MPGQNTARIAAGLSAALAAAVVGCAAVGLTVTQRSDERLAAERQAALQNAIGRLHVAVGDSGQIDPGQLRLIAQRTGVADLRFDASLDAGSGRETQPLIGANGRIAGWFSWMPDRALIRAMYWLWAIVAAVGLVLAIAALATLRSVRRLAGSSARNIETIRKLTTQDGLTGLPNRRIVLERLEDAMATRSGAVTFALIDIDSFRDINDTLGGPAAMSC